MEDVGIDEKGAGIESGYCDQDRHIWSSLGYGRETAMGKHIFCNRSLNMKNIIAVGFDMDYTLAQYKPETFEAYDGTIKKLVLNLGYPPEVRGLGRERADARKGWHRTAAEAEKKRWLHRQRGRARIMTTSLNSS